MSTNPPEDLSLHEVAEQLSVHYMTAYRYVRLGILPARREGRSWRILAADLEAFTSRDEPRTERGKADWTDRFYNRILVADEAGAWGVVEAAFSSGMAIPEAYSELLTPAMQRIGEQWAAGEIDVATEHAASEVAARIIARLGPRMVRRGVRRGTVVLGSTATEMHSLPLAMAADLFRAAQFEVVDLGAYLPPESFASFVAARDDVVAVGIGVTTPGQEDEIAATLAALRTVTAVPIILGGAGVDEETALRLGADGWAPPGRDGVDLVEALLSGPRESS
jgi:excisionase family DNA binding protein